jgi:hypothetical protein
MRERQEDFLMRLAPGTHRVLDGRLAAQRAVLRLQPIEDPLGRMPVPLWGLLVGVEYLMKIGNTAAKTRRGRTWLCRYPGGSACARIFFSVCQPSLYFKQAARWLRPCTSTSWRIAFQISMSLRTSWAPQGNRSDGAVAPIFRLPRTAHLCAAIFIGVRPRHAPPFSTGFNTIESLSE